MKMTLLEIVQDLLGSLEDDEVNSISDTETATRVANIVKENYNNIISSADLPEHWTFYELQTMSDPTKPTMMYLPENAVTLESLKYNKSLVDSVEYEDIRFQPIDTFVNLMYNLDATEDNVYHFQHTINGTTIDFLVKNDVMPSYYTTFDDHTIVFDSYLADEDTFLVKNKTLAYGKVTPIFLVSDDYIPELDQQQFTLLINECKRQVFAELKQTDYPLATSRARKAWVDLQRNKRGVPSPFSEYQSLPNYGRKTR